jgi:hypothetical protein
LRGLGTRMRVLRRSVLPPQKTLMPIARFIWEAIRDISTQVAIQFE